MIVLSNDDGFGAPGLVALQKALSEIDEVYVVAPNGERSASSAALTLLRPITVEKRGDREFALSGTPADCVYFACNGLLPKRPDFVVAGINRGPNLADDLQYSGTAAAAMEGAANGIKSMSISLDWLKGPGENYEVAAQVAAKIVSKFKDLDFPARTYLNVNVPNTLNQPIRGFKWTRMGRREYARAIRQKGELDGKPVYYIGGHLEFAPSENGDCDAIAEGYVSITPITLEKTNFAAFEAYSKQGLFDNEMI